MHDFAVVAAAMAAPLHISPAPDRGSKNSKELLLLLERDSISISIGHFHITKWTQVAEVNVSSQGLQAQ